MGNNNVIIVDITFRTLKYYGIKNGNAHQFISYNHTTFYVHHTLLGQEQATSLLPKGKSRLRWTMTLEYNILQHVQDTSESPLVSARRPNHQ